jgi:hypothetical protein
MLLEDLAGNVIRWKQQENREKRRKLKQEQEMKKKKSDEDKRKTQTTANKAAAVAFNKAVPNPTVEFYAHVWWKSLSSKLTK